MSVYGGPNIITSGLVLNLDAANSKSYPDSGTTWFDISGNRINGTLSQTPTFTNDAIVFGPGLADMTVGNTNNNMYCCEFWVNLPTTITQSSPFTNFFSYDTNPQGYCALGATTSFITDETLTFLSATPELFYRTAIKDTINAGWNHIVFNWETTNYQFYINSLKKTMFAGEGGQTHVPLIFLNNFYINYSGQISAIKVYNRSLTENEVAQNYNAYRGRYGL